MIFLSGFKLTFSCFMKWY